MPKTYMLLPFAILSPPIENRSILKFCQYTLQHNTVCVVVFNCTFVLFYLCCMFSRHHNQPFYQPTTEYLALASEMILAYLLERVRHHQPFSIPKVC